jgi:ABC-type transporter Mla subunit MlaD
MSVMTKIGRAFKRRRGETPQRPEPRVVKWPPNEGAVTIKQAESALREVKSSLAGVGAGTGAHAASTPTTLEPYRNGTARAPKSKQELIAELQKSYEEVITLVRKFDDHLDRQDSRSDRLVQAAERLSEAMTGIERAEERHTEVVHALSSLAGAVRDGQARADDRHEAELSSLARLETVLERCEATDQATKRTLDELRAGISSVGNATDRMGAVLERMHLRDENRDDRLETLVLRTSRLMIWLVAICGGGVMAAIAIAIVVVLKS